jgi:hypothetical protein
MSFQKLTLEQKPIFEKYYAQHKAVESAYDFVMLYAWNVGMTAEWEEWNGYLFVRVSFSQGRTAYYCPIPSKGQPLAPAIRHIYDVQGDAPFSVIHIPARFADELSQYTEWQLQYDRNASDYIYNTHNLATLAGKRYHAKRNFFNRFTSTYNYTFRDYTAADYDLVQDLFSAWGAQGEHDECEVERERECANRILCNIDALGAKCGLLFVDGKLIAMSIVSVSVTGIGQVHFEKALTEYVGAYAAINRLSVEAYLAHTEFINRQEDMGEEGLRKAKLSYHPAYLAEKYRIRRL